MDKNMNDYEQWEKWLDQWKVTYEEKTWHPDMKELIIYGVFSLTAIQFDLENKFLGITSYE